MIEQYKKGMEWDQKHIIQYNKKGKKDELWQLEMAMGPKK